MSQAGSASNGGGGGGGYGLFTYTQVNATTYNASSTDEFLGVVTLAHATTINLPNAPLTGYVYVVKDISGNAATHNITVTTVGGVVNIDNSTTLVMNSDQESVQFMFNGTQYLAF